MSQSGRRRSIRLYHLRRNCESSPCRSRAGSSGFCLLKIHYICLNIQKCCLAICTSWDSGSSRAFLITNSMRMLLRFFLPDYFACHLLPTPKMCWSANQRRLHFFSEAPVENISAKNNSVNSIWILSPMTLLLLSLSVGSSLKRTDGRTFQWKSIWKATSILRQHSRKNPGTVSTGKRQLFILSRPPELCLCMVLTRPVTEKNIEIKGKKHICPEVWQLLFQILKFPFKIIISKYCWHNQSRIQNRLHSLSEKKIDTPVVIIPAYEKYTCHSFFPASFFFTVYRMICWNNFRGSTCSKKRSCIWQHSKGNKIINVQTNETNEKKQFRYPNQSSFW